jgi:uncharacterized iron-regulated membrane protein
MSLAIVRGHPLILPMRSIFPLVLVAFPLMLGLGVYLLLGRNPQSPARSKPAKRDDGKAATADRK